MSIKPISAKEHALKSFSVPYELCLIERHTILLDAYSKEDAIQQVEEMNSNLELLLESSIAEEFEIDEDGIVCEENDDE